MPSAGRGGRSGSRPVAASKANALSQVVERRDTGRMPTRKRASLGPTKTWSTRFRGSSVVVLASPTDLGVLELRDLSATLTLQRYFLGIVCSKSWSVLGLRVCGSASDLCPSAPPPGSGRSLCSPLQGGCRSSPLCLPMAPVTSRLRRRRLRPREPRRLAGTPPCRLACLVSEGRRAVAPLSQTERQGGAGGSRGPLSAVKGRTSKPRAVG